jgi:hypothetical protein
VAASIDDERWSPVPPMARSIRSKSMTKSILISGLLLSAAPAVGGIMKYNPCSVVVLRDVPGPPPEQFIRVEGRLRAA